MGNWKITIALLPISLLASCSSEIDPATLARCESVQPELIKIIESGLTVGGGGKLETASASAVKSNSFKNVYFISAEIQGSGMEGQGEIGLWSTNSLTAGKGMIFSVNSMAREFSKWPDGTKSKAELSQFDDGAQESMECVKHKQSAKGA